MEIKLSGVDEFGTYFEISGEVTDLSELAYMFRQFAVASGFTYVSDVAMEKSNGEVVWSDEY